MRLSAATLAAPEGLAEFLYELGDGENGFSGTGFASGELTLAAFLQSLVDASAGKGVPASRVPGTTFWLLDDNNRIAGMSRLRHRLNDALLIDGGHIGYYIRPSERHKGYGHAVLELTLGEAKKLGLARVLLTADSDNAGSIGVIEGNGGRREDERVDDSGTLYGRFWIELPPEL